MTKEDIFARLREIIVDVLNVYPDEVYPESSFYDDLGADSLDMYQMYLEAENSFGLKPDRINRDSICTVEQAQEVIYLELNRSDR